MTFIKKLVMKGFKSFARETVIDLDRHMNVIVGPNGSGKSNITDALCFVLGRLSIKSIRAAKAAHLIFSGNEHYKGGNQAFVELILDNAEKVFSYDTKEVSIKRIVNKNGQGTYKINGETKTRQEKIDDRLKQVNAVLRERTNYLKNLEDEREQALKFQKLQDTIKKSKYSII